MMDAVARDEAREQWAMSIRDSDYIGWVAYVDGQPIFEAVRRPVGAYQLAATAPDAPIHRAEDRRTMQWRDLPHERVERVELYWARGQLSQPAFRIDRAPDCHTMRFLQMKRGGISVPTQAGERPTRHGLVAYVIGYWDPARPLAELWEIGDREVRKLGAVKDPWAPKPEGFGLNRRAFGL